jgi:outer membrane protein assembly factor BamB
VVPGGKPALAGGRLFVSGSAPCWGANTTDGSFAAYEAATGQEQWRLPARFTGGCAGTFQLALDEGANVEQGVAVMLVEGGVRGLDAVTGAQLWTSPVPADHKPIDAGELVLLLSGEEVHALDRRTGTEKWVTRVGPRPANLIYAGEDADYVEVNSTTAFFLVVTGPGGQTSPEFPDYGITALDLKTGTPVWHAQLGHDIYLYYRLLADDSAVVVGFERHEVLGINGGAAPSVVLALDQATGTELWRKDLVFVGRSVGRLGMSPSEFLDALDGRTGAMRWEISNPCCTTVLAADETTVVVAGESGPGSWDWRVVPENGFGRTLSAFDASNGSRLWEKILLQSPDLYDTNTSGVGATLAGGIVYISHRVLNVSHEAPEPE